MDNEYLQELNQLDWIQIIDKRQQLCKKYSWTIPTKKIIEHIAKLSPIVEMGAGTGYWSYLIEKAGGTIISYDIEPYINDWCNYNWKEVKKGSHEVLINHKDHTLFLSWPPLGYDIAYNCLSNYMGKRVIYIGEWRVGCCGKVEFFDLLDKEWNLSERREIYRHRITNDRVYIFEKKEFK